VGEIPSASFLHYDSPPGLIAMVTRMHCEPIQDMPAVHTRSRVYLVLVFFVDLACNVAMASLTDFQEPVRQRSPRPFAGPPSASRPGRLWLCPGGPYSVDGWSSSFGRLPGFH
jgi:hypothetical protein